MQYIDIRNRSFQLFNINLLLSILKVAIFELIIKIVLRGLSNSDVKRETIKGLILFNRSLLGVYNLVNKIKRIKSAI